MSHLPEISAAKSAPKYRNQSKRFQFAGVVVEDGKHWTSIPRFAAAKGISRTTISRMVDAGLIKTRQYGNRKLLLLDSIKT